MLLFGFVGLSFTASEGFPERVLVISFHPVLAVLAVVRMG
jgi:hypothetical protein